MANGLFGGGNGTIESPYIVQDGADFNAIRNNKSASYRQDRDISLSAYPDFTPIGIDGSGAFFGIYDGGGFKIRDLNIKTYRESNGLFGQFVGKVLGVNVVGGSVVGDKYSSTLGYYYGTSNVEFCSSQGLQLNFTGDFCSGLVSCSNYNLAIVNDCFNTSNVGFRSNINSHFSGVTNAIATRCYNTGNIEFIDSSYGFASGVSHHGAVDCYNTGNITCIKEGTSNGYGFNGVTDASALRCYNTGNITLTSTGASYASSTICGVSKLNATDCYNTGDLLVQSSSYARVPFVFGITNTVAVNCYNTGIITAYGNAFGICGNYAKNCFMLAPKMKRTPYSSSLNFYAITDSESNLNSNNFVLESCYLEL